MRVHPAALLLTALVPALACGAQARTPVLRMATTTSTDDTGLLDYLAPIFKKATGVELRWVSVGTGKALEHGKNCDVDVLLVHAPEAEKRFVAEGFGLDRREVMWNDFVLIGPPSDPAGVKGKTASEALKAVADDASTEAWVEGLSLRARRWMAEPVE